MFATYGWSHSVEEMGNISQLDLGLYSDYSEMNSSIVIVTNNSALMVSHLWTYEILSCIFILKEKKYDNLELKIKVLHYVCVQTACNKDCGCRGFFVLRGFFIFFTIWTFVRMFGWGRCLIRTEYVVGTLSWLSRFQSC